LKRTVREGGYVSARGEIYRMYLRAVYVFRLPRSPSMLFTMADDVRLEENFVVLQRPGPAFLAGM
jgi:hypothetical protein